MDKGQTSVALIILFIAALFLGAIVAGVYIVNTDKLQASTKKTGDEVRRGASSIFTMDIYGEDGRDRNIEEFRHVIKLPPGSDPIDLEGLMLTVSSTNGTASLTYRGIGSGYTRGTNGYNTFTEEEVGALGNYFSRINTGSGIDSDPPVNINLDLDLDGTNDTVVVCQLGISCDAGDDGDTIQFNLSTAGLIKVSLIDQNGNSMDISAKNNQVYGNYLTPISDGTTTYGYVTITGSEGALGTYTIFDDQMTVYQVPHTLQEDIDDDGSPDTLVINATHVILHYSSKGDVADQLNDTRGVAYPFGFTLDGAKTISVNITLQDNESAESFGTITIDGTTSRGYYIDEDVTFTITPARLNKGYYGVQYVQRSEDWQEGVFRDGDILRLYYETAQPLIEGEFVRVILASKTGPPVYTDFYMPNVLSHQSEPLYPTR